MISPDTAVVFELDIRFPIAPILALLYLRVSWPSLKKYPLALSSRQVAAWSPTLTCRREPYSDSIHHATRHCIFLSRTPNLGIQAKMAAGEGEVGCGGALRDESGTQIMMSVSARCRRTKDADARRGDEVWTTGEGEGREKELKSRKIGYGNP
jgi:hypothetical protein